VVKYEFIEPTGVYCPPPTQGQLILPQPLLMTTLYTKMARTKGPETNTQFEESGQG